MNRPVPVRLCWISEYSGIVVHHKSLGAITQAVFGHEMFAECEVKLAPKRDLRQTFIGLNEGGVFDAELRLEHESTSQDLFQERDSSHAVDWLDYMR